jgi:demethylmenaquinone methyltransferase/2-methoxy-6-polyprenyl-1,4-benzoquinol methylase
VKPSRVIEAAGTTDQIRRAYDLWSIVYDKVAGPLENGPRRRALELAEIKAATHVLEVGVGTGAMFLEILKLVHRQNIVCGIDVSLPMLKKAQRLAWTHAFKNAGLSQAVAWNLPFRDETFDVVYSSYLMDLLALDVIPRVLGEFRRVLRSNGLLVIVNLSRTNPHRLSWLERLYQLLPASWVPYLLGSCRPVFMEEIVRTQSFSEIKREFRKHLTHSEIVTARKSSADSLTEPNTC